MWKTVEAEAGKVRVAEIERRRKKGRSRKKMRRKRKKTKERKKDRGEKSSRRMGDLG